jgi:hypothetical protein
VQAEPGMKRGARDMFSKDVTYDVYVYVYVSKVKEKVFLTYTLRIWIP